MFSCCYIKDNTKWQITHNKRRFNVADHYNNSQPAALPYNSSSSPLRLSTLYHTTIFVSLPKRNRQLKFSNYVQTTIKNCHKKLVLIVTKRARNQIWLCKRYLICWILTFCVLTNSKYSIRHHIYILLIYLSEKTQNHSFQIFYLLLFLRKVILDVTIPLRKPCSFYWMTLSGRKMFRWWLYIP